MYRHNSTIRVKEGLCNSCPESKGKQPLIKGLCQYHYQLASKMKSLNKQAEKEIKDDGLSDLIEILDHIFSRYIRLKYADKDGYVTCFISGTRHHWKEIDNGHFISRANMFLRFDERNCRPCSITENRYKDGNIPGYAKKLEEETPGIVDILMEEAHVVCKWSRAELNAMIVDYRKRGELILKEIKC
jgi:hypothetical protein